MAFPQGINFRGTSGYVTDISPADYEIATTANYPHTTVQGNNVGWETPPLLSLDENAALDARLAGRTYHPDNDGVYRIDLPSTGSYNIRSSAGRFGYAVNTAMSVKDTTTVLGTLSQTPTTAPAKYRDAVDAEYTAAAWPGSNTASPFTFTTTICRVVVAINSVLTHVYLEANVTIVEGVITSGIRRGRSRRQRAGWSVSSPGGFF